jgi:DnaK suppressor protein
MSVTLPHNYRPSDAEEFMNPLHLEYFRKRLMEWRTQLVKETQETVQQFNEQSVEPDLIDSANQEAERRFELRTRDRARKLIIKIDEALHRIEDGSYGFCEMTGEPIALRRLEARPIATYCIEAQEAHERKEKIYKEEW